MKKLTHAKFPQNLKQARLACGMTQTQLSIQTGIHQTQLCRIERGASSVEKGVTLEVFTRLANELNVSADSLLKG